jgi:zinc D-Ala-D-Ala carboxypeptidase
VREYLSRMFSIIACVLFGNSAVSIAKTITPESNNRALQNSIQRQGYFQIPGIGLVSVSDPIYVGSHFTWGEATRDGSRIPRDTLYRGEWVSGEEIADNITKLARELDKIRFQFGNNPIDINSWYRPPEVNQATDGAAQDSYHMIGLAADFRVRNRDSYKVYSVLNLTWKGGLGRYVGRTHGDLRHLVGDDLARW